MFTRLRRERASPEVVVADDERPARSFLVSLLRSFDDVAVSEAASGKDAVTIIEKERPDLALLDWQMPELDGIGVVRMLKKDAMPLVAFVTAYDDAVRAFEVNAVDYLLKPVEKARLRETVNPGARTYRTRGNRLRAGLTWARRSRYETLAKPPYLERIPVRRREDVVIVPVNKSRPSLPTASCTSRRFKERHTITYRLKDLERRLDPRASSDLVEALLVNVDLITKLNTMPGGTHVAVLSTGQKLPVSRLQSRVLRERFLKL
jgi:two-component system LytT family response regulator